MKKVAIIQSSYIPWKGYFDIINSVDEFILLDDVQYTRRDWRNRNKIKTPHGIKWLTIPMKVKGNYSELISNMTVSDAFWNIKHFDIISSSYRKAPYFKKYKSFFEDLYKSIKEIYLSKINYIFIKSLCQLMNIKTKISFSEDYKSEEKKTKKLLEICKKAKADIYISGPSAKSYLDESLFRSQGIEVHWFNYDGYKEYPQLYPPFSHNVSIVDLLFNTGEDFRLYMKSFIMKK